MLDRLINPAVGCPSAASLPPIRPDYAVESLSPAASPCPGKYNRGNEYFCPDNHERVLASLEVATVLGGIVALFVA